MRKRAEPRIWENTNISASANFTHVNPVVEDILKSLPSEVYQISAWKAFTGLFASILLTVVGYVALALAPWFLMPITWLFIGTVFAGLYSVGYDCGSGAFSKHKIVNRLVGHLVSLPLMLPFESWSLQLMEARNKTLQKTQGILHSIVTGDLWFLSSSVQWLRANFALRSIYQPGHRLSVILSISSLYAFACVFFSVMIYNLGLWGLIKFWLAPWLVYHFWISSFLATSYKSNKLLQDLKDTKMRLIFHCKYPRWVEVLTHNANLLMTSQNLGTLIPSYNLKSSYRALKEHAGQYLEEVSFSWNMLKGDGVQINWVTCIFLLLSPVVALCGLFTTEIKLKTMLVGFISYYIGGLGITMGYHRLWAHRSYDASLLVKIVLLIMGTGTFEGSVLWWSRDHRAHHRFSDTDKDPYGVNKGLWWAHIGWMLVKQDESKIGKTDMSDLEADPLLRFQDKHYSWLAVLIGFVIPTLICGYGWGDFRGGFFFAAILRTVILMQATFCINSLAHWWGDATFTDQRSPRDSYLVSLVTFGEGYHNFHHEFPYDYRNGVRYHYYDPGKWSIYLLSLIGLTYNLKRFPSNEIEKGHLQMQMKLIERKKATISWGPAIETLPVYTSAQVKERCLEGSELLVIDGVVYDVHEFKKIHPGGEKLIINYIGKDASIAFNGVVYEHSNAARNLMSHFRIGKVDSQMDSIYE